MYGDNLAEQYEHEGIDVQIRWDHDPEFCNPRTSHECNIGVMVCWHPDYILGDQQISGSGGAVETVFETETGRTDFDSMRHIARYLTFARGARVVIPLYLYDHSGISMSAGRPNPFDNPTVKRDEFGQGLGWDTSMVGFIYDDPDLVIRGCGDPNYKPPDYAGTQQEWLAEQLLAEVKEYDRWLRGEVYYYVVADGTPEEDSCGGFIGDEWVKEAANEAAKYAAKARAKRVWKERVFALDPNPGPIPA